MAGLPITLTDEELKAIRRWYLAHYLAEENTDADDELHGRLIGLQALNKRAA